MIATKLTSIDGMEFTAQSAALLTADEIREWERDIAWDTQELKALDNSSGEHFVFVQGDWLKV